MRSYKPYANAEVLIVEDNILAGEMLKGMLEELEYEVVGTAVDGLQAIQMTQNLEPDLIIMDIELSGMDGIEAAQHIYEACPTPVVVLTAYDMPALLEQASASGVGAYLTKPPNPYDLEHAIVTTMARFDDMMALRRLNDQLKAEIAERERAEAAHQADEQRYRATLADVTGALAQELRAVHQCLDGLEEGHTDRLDADALHLLQRAGAGLDHMQAILDRLTAGG
jgi:response regulator NasT